MDKYRHLRETGQRIAAEAVGKRVGELKALCEHAGFAFRYLSIDSKPTMITSDVRMDRISCHVSGGKVTAAAIG